MLTGMLTICTSVFLHFTKNSSFLYFSESDAQAENVTET